MSEDLFSDEQVITTLTNDEDLARSFLPADKREKR